MSQENVENLRQGFEEFARGDVEAVLERLDPDVDWRPAIAPILGVEAVRGREAVRGFFTRDLFDGFDEFRAEPCLRGSRGCRPGDRPLHRAGREHRP
jgi:hypothetical protein